MKEKIQTYAWILALGLMLGGAVLEYGPAVWRLVPVVGPSGEVKIAAIIGESGGQSKLTKEQIHVLATATDDFGVYVVDRDVKDRDRKPPAELVPLLDAVKGETEYKLVIQWTSGAVDVYPLPDSPAKLKELLQ